MSSEKYRVAIVQPVIAPYRRPLLEILSQNSELETRVLLTARALAHRPDWVPSETEPFDYEYCTHASITLKLYQYSPDVIICTNPKDILSVIPYSLLHACKILTWVEDTGHTEQALHKRYRFVRSLIYKYSDAFLANGTESIKYLEKIGVKNKTITRVYCPIDNSAYYRTGPVKTKSDTDPYRWISVGRLYKQKGFDELIDIWSSLDENFHKKNELLIVGEGSYKNNLVGKIKSAGLTNVYVKDYTGQEALVPLYHSSHIFVFPTLRDIWGLVVNEAMASELPVICSVYAGCYSDLVLKRNGYHFDPLDLNGSTNVFRSAWLQNDSWIKMGKSSLDIIKEYDVQIAGKIIHESIRSLRKLPRQGDSS